MNPPHGNFQAMKDFLKSTGDIQGHLSNYRQYIKFGQQTSDPIFDLDN